MTETEWMECTDPRLMLAFVRGEVSQRKMRLFACACCRRSWQFCSDVRAQRAVELSERWADDPNLADEAQEQELAIWNEHPLEIVSTEERTLWAASASLWADAGTGARYAVSVLSVISETQNSTCANDLRCLLGTPIPPTAARPGLFRVAAAGLLKAFSGSPMSPKSASPTRQPFVPLSVYIDPRWFTSTVVDLANAIYDERAFDRMPILADALMDAGCDNDEIIAHCWGEGAHVRGCWVVDLILGKE
jgi:hypothetical protein